MSGGYDRRITPARPDVAAAQLKGKVEAKKFVEGRTVIVARGTTALRAAPSHEFGLETELLFGEAFTIYAEEDGWAWGQAGLDSYVGYARADAFADGRRESTHRVTALATPLLIAPDVKRPSRNMLPLNAKLIVAEAGERFVRLSNGLYVFAGHITPLAASTPDWVAVAERFVGVPYLWGGKTAAGIDCSGLIQIALEVGGILAPRDTDMMEASLGIPLPQRGVEGRSATAELSQARALGVGGLRRGDLIFWKGHVGVMLDPERLLHANAFFMEVTVEPLATARARIAATDGNDIRTIKRL